MTDYGFPSRTAVVTGGASGIGRATVLALLGAGSRVAVADRDADQLDSLRDDVKDAGLTGGFIAVPTDVTDERSVESFFLSTRERLGPPDIIVAAAGIQAYGDAETTGRSSWDEVFAVNVTGAYLTIAAALPSLRASARGAVVVVSSVQSIATQQNVLAYSTSKGALNAMVRSLAVDEARFGVRVNAVLPGSVDTPMLRASAKRFSDGTDQGIQNILQQWARAHPLNRVAQPAEVAQAIVFLASERASMITGAALPVDGGLLASLAVGLAT